CLIALAVIYLDLGERGMDLWAVFPAVVGLAGLATRWAAAPIFLVLALGFSLNVDFNQSAQYSVGSSLLIPDLVLCASVLAFVMAHYRLTLIDQAFAAPPPPRKEKSKSNDAARWPPAGSPSVPRPPSL